MWAKTMSCESVPAIIILSCGLISKQLNDSTGCGILYLTGGLVAANECWSCLSRDCVTITVESCEQLTVVSLPFG